MKSKYFLSVVFIACTYFFSNANNFQDSLPLLNPEYKGYRLAVTDFSSFQKEEWIHVKFTVINTGKKDIILGEDVSIPPIIFNFDGFGSNSTLKNYQSSFKETLLNTELKLRTGEVLYKQELKVKSNHKLPANSEVQSAELVEVSENNYSKKAAIAKGGFEEMDHENQCADLIIESVSIVKKSKNTVTLKYKIKNKGKQPVSIIGPLKGEEDNLAMTFHMSSSEKLTRGSIPIGGMYIKNGNQIPDGKLYPGKSLTDEIKLDIRNMTKFTPIIILEIDPYLSVQECNETNNLNHIKVKE